MLLQRTLVTILLLPLGIAAIYFGGIPYGLVLLIFFLAAAHEYVQLFCKGGYQPSEALVLLGTAALTVGRLLGGFASAPWMISLLVLLAMTYHLLAFERGRDQAAADFCITLGGVFYLGWIGAYLISLRNLENGLWWVLLVLPAVWFTDSGAYLVGITFGRHRLSPRLSPKKTWEGYLGGVAAGALGGAIMGFLLPLLAGPASGINPARGALLGLIVAALSVLGDLGESMTKRQVGAKDSGTFLPGHGGAFDRIDSWLWAGVIGYYVVTWLLWSAPAIN